MAAPIIRTFHHREFTPEVLVAAKRGRTVSVCLPARNEQDTVGDIVATLHDELVRDCPLIDELVVLDDQSTDAPRRSSREVGQRPAPANRAGRTTLGENPQDGEWAGRSLPQRICNTVRSDSGRRDRT